MATLEWDTLEDRRVEAGVDRGVLFVEGQPGVPWNGLTGVDENEKAKVTPIYFDGKKINDLFEYGDYKATLTAWSFPDEFLPCMGVYEEQLGVEVFNQPRKRFDLSYRHLIFDSTGAQAYYKIHLVWGLIATPSGASWTSGQQEFSPQEFEWEVSGVPPSGEGFRPSCHIVIDSRKIDAGLLADIEAWLYGDDTQDSTMPSQKGFLAFVRKWERFLVYDNNDGSWTASSLEDGVITITGTGDNEQFTIETPEAAYIDVPEGLYQLTSSDKNEEDI